jgi:CheY-like chemotaxis protein
MAELTVDLRGVVVLVVEDKPDVLEATGYLIEAAFGCSVLTAQSCVEALEILDSDKRVDLIFSDVVLPGKDGLTLARLARERRPGIPIALVTGFADEVDAICERGFLALLKPYSVEQVQAVLSDLLSARFSFLPPLQRPSTFERTKHAT